MGQPRARRRSLCLDHWPTQDSATNLSCRGLQPRLRTPVDRRWKKAPKFSLFLIFRPARRAFPVARLDRQVLSCQVDPIKHVFFPNGQNTIWDVEPEILISIFADCSPSHVPYNCTRPARLGAGGPDPIPDPQAACPYVDLSVTRHSSF